MLSKINEQLLKFGVGENMYFVAYMYKYAKENNISLVYSTDNEILEQILKSSNEDELIKRCYERIKLGYKIAPIKEIFEIFKEFDDKTISQISLMDFDNSMYNMSTPSSLSVLARKILNTVDGNKVVDLGSYIGGFLLEYANESNNNKYTGYDIDFRSIDVAKVRFALLGIDSKFIQADIFKCCNEHRFDKVFINHPFIPKSDFIMLNLINNTNDINFKYTPNISSDWFFLEKATEFMTKQGKAVGIVLNASLIKITDSNVRKAFLDNGLIEAIIALPEKIFPYSGISSSLVVLSNGNKNIKYINASNLFKSERRINTLDVEKIFELYSSNKENDLVKIVDYDELEKYDYNLSYNLYFTNYKNELINPTKLKDVCVEMFRGYQISAKEMDEYIVEDKKNYSYKILNLSNINNGIIDYNLPSINLDDKKLDRYLIQDGDIIISAKSSKIKVGLVTINKDEKIIASGNLIVVRPDKNKINPTYLKMFLESEKGTSILNMIQTGTVILSINPSQLKEIEISLLDKDKQDKLATVYLAKLDAIEIAKRKIEQLEKELRNISLENI